MNGALEPRAGAEGALGVCVGPRGPSWDREMAGRVRCTKVGQDASRGNKMPVPGDPQASGWVGTCKRCHSKGAANVFYNTKTW